MHFQYNNTYLLNNILNDYFSLFSTLVGTRSKTTSDLDVSEISNENLKLAQIVTGVTSFETDFVSSRFGYFICRISHMLWSQVQKWQILFQWIKVQKSQILLEIWHLQGSAKWSVVLMTVKASLPFVAFA